MERTLSPARPLLGHCICVFPSLSGGAKRGLMIWPIVESRWVKISTGGPHECLNLLVELYLGEVLRIPQWAEELSLEHAFKVDRSPQAVLERDSERVGPDSFEALDAVNWVLHERRQFFSTQ